MPLDGPLMDGSKKTLLLGAKRIQRTNEMNPESAEEQGREPNGAPD